jgi:PIN domain nuclease of toxin-antitoxin system
MALRDPENVVFVGPLCYWEISLKLGLGKLDLPGTDPAELPAAAARLGFSEAPLAADIMATYHRLPRHPEHRDPFDRMLVWHAIQRRLTLLSRDRRLAFYRPHGLEFEW